MDFRLPILDQAAGKVPVSILSYKNMNCNLARPPHALGSGPENLFLERIKFSRFSHEDQALGNEPLSWLQGNHKLLSCHMDDHSAGRVPCSMLLVQFTMPVS
jgi:hypothetical protein